MTTLGVVFVVYFLLGSVLPQQLVTFKDDFKNQPNTSFYYYAGPWANGAPGMNVF